MNAMKIIIFFNGVLILGGEKDLTVQLSPDKSFPTYDSQGFQTLSFGEG